MERIAGKRVIGISCISLLLYSTGAEGFRTSIQKARDLELDGVQVLPLRGYNFAEFKSNDPIISVENAWDAKSESPSKPDIEETPGPPASFKFKALNWFLFGPETSSSKAFEHLRRAFPKAIYSAHHFGKDPVEMQPEISLKFDEYMDYAPGVVVDTYHIRRPHLLNGKIIENWEMLLMEIPSNRIKLIHIHPTLKGLDDFLNGKDEQTKWMLETLRYRTNCPVIIEVLPFITLDKLVRIREATQNYLGS